MFGSNDYVEIFEALPKLENEKLEKKQYLNREI